MARCEAIESSHVLNLCAGLYVASCVYARTNTSCVTSSASVALLSIRYARFCTASLYRSTSTAKASCSPASTSSTSSASLNASTIASRAYSLDRLCPPTVTVPSTERPLLIAGDDTPLAFLRRVLLSVFGRDPITPSVPEAPSVDSINFHRLLSFSHSELLQKKRSSMLFTSGA